MPTLKQSLISTILALCAGVVHAHDYKLGDVHIDHPYAKPSVPGSSTGAAYIASLDNLGATADRLVRASSPLAGHVELHSMGMDANGVMHMKEEAYIALPPGASVKMKPGSGWHLMLMDLKQTIKDGEHFPMTLEFEHAGKIDVDVQVQAPHAHGASATSGEHMH
ncbi:MAG: copper chaperone PCu(A)C [Burkholderiaceae bacterium]|nr:copper chaperone PCu(A)C [Roseateles sp.]MBV8470843.1 copper chaperone PCu(A)C [Burkholderiaceae bacterium]